VFVRISLLGSRRTKICLSDPTYVGRGTSPLPHPTTHKLYCRGWSGGGAGWCRDLREQILTDKTLVSQTV